MYNIYIYIYIYIYIIYIYIIYIYTNIHTILKTSRPSTPKGTNLHAVQRQLMQRKVETPDLCIRIQQDRSIAFSWFISGEKNMVYGRYT